MTGSFYIKNNGSLLGLEENQIQLDSNDQLQDKTYVNRAVGPPSSTTTREESQSSKRE